MKVHLKLKGKAICGLTRKVRPLKFATDHNGVTCGRCKRAIAT